MQGVKWMCLEGLTAMCFSCLLEKRKVQRDFPKSKANFLLFKYLEMNFSLLLLQESCSSCSTSGMQPSKQKLVVIEFADENRQGGVVCWPLLLLVCLRGKEA